MAMTVTRPHPLTARERVGRHPWVRLPRPADRPGPLTGELAVRVARAALDAHPGATIRSVEVDGAGRYTARLTSLLGERVIVTLDADLEVLGWLVELP